VPVVLFPSDGSLPCISARSASTSSFSRPAQRLLALQPAHSRSHLMTLSIGGFSRVVTFPTAPIATGWNDPCRKGLSPSQEPCLSTAHAYVVLSPAIGLFATVACGYFRKLDASVEASGPHDFAVRVSAVRQERPRVHCIPSRVRDDREPPLCGTGRCAYRTDLVFRKTRIFFIKGLDRKSVICPSGRIMGVSRVKMPNEAQRYRGEPVSRYS